MNDFNTLLTMMGQGQENPELCGQKVPTVDQVPPLPSQDGGQVSRRWLKNPGLSRFQFRKSGCRTREEGDKSDLCGGLASIHVRADEPPCFRRGPCRLIMDRTAGVVSRSDQPCQSV